MFKRWRRNRQLAKVKPGNGSALQPYRWWQLFGRSVFFIELEESDGRHTYAVDARYFQDELSGQEGDPSWDDDGTGSKDRDGTPFSEMLDDWLGRGAGDGDDIRLDGENPGKAPAALYRDGVQLYRSKLPATFPVPGGVIEVAASGYGASRMHFVGPDGVEQVLAPHRRTAEGLRARFGRRFPALSKAIGAAAVLILLVGLITGIPQGLEMITSLEPIAERFGTFTSPIRMPVWANVSLLIAGIVAATERALTLRNHWLIDIDTTWTAFG